MQQQLFILAMPMLPQIPLSFHKGINQLTSGPDSTDRKLSTAVKVPLKEEKTGKVITWDIQSGLFTHLEHTLVALKGRPATSQVEELHRYPKVK